MVDSDDLLTAERAISTVARSVAAMDKNGVKGLKDALAEATGKFVPDRTVLPMVRTWPVPSDTATTLFVRREGDQLLGVQGKRPMPLSSPDLFVARVLRGEAAPGKATEGLDSRGRVVLGVLHPLDGAPWHLATREIGRAHV